MNKPLKAKDVIKSVCGKQPEVAALRDLLNYALNGLSLIAVEGRKVGASDMDANHFTCEAMLATLPTLISILKRLTALINKSAESRERLKTKVKQASGKVFFGEGLYTFISPGKQDEMIALGKSMASDLIWKKIQISSPLNIPLSSV